MKLMRLLFKRAIFAPNKVIGSQQKDSNDHYCPSTCWARWWPAWPTDALTSFKREKNKGIFSDRSAFQTSDQTKTFKCARARCKTGPFICKVEKLSGLQRSIRITDHFTCTSANVIYCITCTLCKKLYFGETGRRPGDRFREHLRDVKKDDKNASKPVARHFNFPNHSKQQQSMASPYIKEARKAAKP